MLTLRSKGQSPMVRMDESGHVDMAAHFSSFSIDATGSHGVAAYCCSQQFGCAMLSV